MAFNQFDLRASKVEAETASEPDMSPAAEELPAIVVLREHVKELNCLVELKRNHIERAKLGVKRDEGILERHLSQIADIEAAIGVLSLEENA